jgi:citronellol/citronellal dehydrogenase
MGRCELAAEGEQRIAVVAGGGSGIGRGCALRLASEGYRLILVGRSEEKLASTVSEVEAAGGSASAFQADVRDWDRLGELAASVEAQGIDLLVNSAGGQFAKPAAELSRNGWKAVVETNLDGSFFLCRQLHGALRKRSGSIVLVVANIWQRPAALLAHSGAARAGIVNLARNLALEWAADGIRVNAVSPGLTDTPALDKRYGPVLEKVPLARMGTVDEVVDAILFMARAAYVTGEVLTVDGGLHLA